MGKSTVRKTVREVRQRLESQFVIGTITRRFNPDAPRGFSYTFHTSHSYPIIPYGEDVLTTTRKGTPKCVRKEAREEARRHGIDHVENLY